MRIIITSILLFIGLNTFAQLPRFEKIAIGNTACAVYAPGDPMFQLTYSEDSARVFTGEVVTDSFNYFVICVAFSEPMGDDKVANTALLKSYLDHLQQAFGITRSAGYGEGHTMDDHPQAIGVIDYWVDGDGYQWQVKGWIDTGHLAVLGIYGAGEYPYFNASRLFLDGFRFPGQ